MNMARQFSAYTPPVDNDSSSGTVSMLQIRDFLGRQWRVILLVVLLSLAVGAAYVFLSPS